MQALSLLARANKTIKIVYTNIQLGAKKMKKTYLGFSLLTILAFTSGSAFAQVEQVTSMTVSNPAAMIALNRVPPIQYDHRSRYHPPTYGTSYVSAYANIEVKISGNCVSLFNNSGMDYSDFGRRIPALMTGKFPPRAQLRFGRELPEK